MPSLFARTLQGGLVALSLAAAVFASSLPAAAQQSPAGQPSAAQVQLARELIESNGSLRAVDDMVPAYLEQTRNMFTATNPDLAAPLSAVAAGLRQEFAAKRTEVVDGIARAYAARFTEAELRELVAFYKSPTGKKFIAVLPIVLQDSFERMQAWSTKLSEEMVARMRAEMRKKGHEL
ncbi:MAG: DUF2059 domain-containing protein [Bacteroidales bacterium]|nr:DUF2059 domain-containing protein [Bacteroidales bacterium]